jgi:hypothetical protein
VRNDQSCFACGVTRGEHRQEGCEQYVSANPRDYLAVVAVLVLLVLAVAVTAAVVWTMGTGA